MSVARCGYRCCAMWIPVIRVNPRNVPPRSHKSRKYDRLRSGRQSAPVRSQSFKLCISPCFAALRSPNISECSLVRCLISSLQVSAGNLPPSATRPPGTRHLAVDTLEPLQIFLAGSDSWSSRLQFSGRHRHFVYNFSQSLSLCIFPREGDNILPHH